QPRPYAAVVELESVVTKGSPKRHVRSQIGAGHPQRQGKAPQSARQLPRLDVVACPGSPIQQHLSGILLAQLVDRKDTTIPPPGRWAGVAAGHQNQAACGGTDPSCAVGNRADVARDVANNRWSRRVRKHRRIVSIIENQQPPVAAYPL